MLVCPEIASLVSKIPFQLAKDYSEQNIEWDGEGDTEPIRRFNKRVYMRLSDPLRELFGPNSHPERVKYQMDRAGKNIRPIGRKFLIDVDALDDAVEFSLRMIGSRQRFEWKWKGLTTADGAVIEEFPALWAFAGQDGMPLEKPKLWLDLEPTDIVARGCQPLGWEENEGKMERRD